MTHGHVRGDTGEGKLEPPDEPWVEDATERDLRGSLVRLADLRGGEVVVRPTDVAEFKLVLTARRHRDRIEVRASDPMTSWRAAWTMPAALPSAHGILRDLEVALAGVVPGDENPRLSVRLEQQDEAAAWSADSGYLFMLGWLPAFAAVVGIGFTARPPGTETWVEILDGSLAGSAGSLLLLTAIAITALLPAALGSSIAEGFTNRHRWGYALSRWVSVGAAALACAAYLVAVVLAGSSWAPVLAAPWVIGLVALTGPGILGRVRPAG